MDSFELGTFIQDPSTTFDRCSYGEIIQDVLLDIFGYVGGLS